MKHTYLIEPGYWETRGKFIDEQGRKLPAQGYAKVTHSEEGAWLNDTSLRYLPPVGEAVEIKNNYNIMPFEKGADYTIWISDNKPLGRIVGKLILAGNSIIFMYYSENLEYAGVEIMKMVNKDTYKAAGHLFKGNKKISTWSVEMKRK